MSNAAISALLPVYAQPDLDLVRGAGAYLWDADGRRYLDCSSGIAVTALGHCHPHLVAALTQQAQEVWHLSNLFRIQPTRRLAERLIAHSFAETVFFCNSGAEANEAAIKMARRYHWTNGAEQRQRIITVEGAFHGRTMATISAGGQEKYLTGFKPALEGFDQVPFGDHEALHAAITGDTAAILIEPIQGESGIRPVPAQCLRGLRDLCDQHGLLLIFDEIQCGMGRTGKLFAHEWAGATPDIMTLAKGLGGGFPVGACLATARAASGMVPGTHGTTFGGNPLAGAVGNAVLDVMLEEDFFPQMQAVAAHLAAGLDRLVAAHPAVIESWRGQGLMLGMKAKVPNADLLARLRAHGLLTVAAGDNVVRLLPPLILTAEQADEALQALDTACAELEGVAA